MEENDIEYELQVKENNIEKELHELNQIVNLINSNCHEEISKYFQSLDSCTSIHGDNDSVTIQRDNQQPETDKFLSIASHCYSDRDKLISSVRDLAATLGYVTVIKKSKRDRYVRISCDRGGEYRINKIPVKRRATTVKRTTRTRLINCPFEIWGRRKATEVWEVELKNLTHNHEPSNDLSKHPSHRCFSKEEFITIKEMTLSGITPKQILSTLRQGNKNLQSISRSVYNARAKLRKESLEDRTMIESLFEELGQSDFVYDVQRDHEGHLSHLFMAHPVSIALTKNYSSIFVMDCTYKTNKYGMPLLNIVGVTSFNSTFFSAFVFMRKEETSNYIWALQRFIKVLNLERPSAIVTDRELALINALNFVFSETPHLLCVWHIEKNILAKCKRKFKTSEEWELFLVDWTSVIKSPDESSFSASWVALIEKHKEYEFIINYIHKTWLPFKERFIYAWTKKVLHFGNHVTSRVEGAHSKLKKYLQVSTGDLRGVKDKLCLAIDNEFQEIKTQLSHEKIRIPHKFHIPLFHQLIGHVSLYALKELFKQYELAILDMSSTCKGNFTNSMGLPCAHKIRETKYQSLRLDDIHPQWRLDIRSFNYVGKDKDDIGSLLGKVHDHYQKAPLALKEDMREKISNIVDSSSPMTLEPKAHPHKGRPSNATKRKNKSSTTREPSLFDIVESTRYSRT